MLHKIAVVLVSGALVMKADTKLGWSYSLDGFREALGTPPQRVLMQAKHGSTSEYTAVPGTWAIVKVLTMSSVAEIGAAYGVGIEVLKTGNQAWH